VLVLVLLVQVQVRLAPRPLELVLVQPVLFVVPVLQIPVPLEQVLLTLVMLQEQARLVQVFWAAWSLPLLGPKLFALETLRLEAGNEAIANTQAEATMAQHAYLLGSRKWVSVAIIDLSEN
jgi:hypothetical protein